MNKAISHLKYILYGFFLLPFVSLAQGPVGDEGGPGPIGGEGGPAGSAGSSLVNPLGNKTLMQLLSQILDVILVFAVPLIVFMIIYAGFMYVTARGNENQVGKASKALMYAVVGGMIILGAKVIMLVIQGTVDAFR